MKFAVWGQASEAVTIQQSSRGWSLIGSISGCKSRVCANHNFLMNLSVWRSRQGRVMVQATIVFSIVCLMLSREPLG